jgi:hypothetical protein
MIIVILPYSGERVKNRDPDLLQHVGMTNPRELEQLR